MVEEIPFGKMKRKSVEQIALGDYDYFVWIRKAGIRIPSLRERFDFVYHVANNFVSEKTCSQCSKPARYLSVYTSRLGGSSSRVSSTPFLYDKEECFEGDGNVSTEKGVLEDLAFDAALSSTKFDTNELIELMARCMGIREGRRTKEYLEEFFNTRRLWVPYGNSGLVERRARL